jgi:hypothetical protein
MPDGNNGNCSDSSDSSHDKYVEDYVSRKTEEIELLQQQDFHDEDIISANSKENT